MRNPRFRSRSRDRLIKLKSEKNHKIQSWFSLVLMVLSWLIFGFILFTVDAKLIQNIPWPNSYAPMLLSIGFVISSSIFFLTKHLGSSIFWAFLIMFFVLLRFQGLGQWWNGFLLLLGGLLIDFIWLSQGRLYQKIWKFISNLKNNKRSEVEEKVE